MKLLALLLCCATANAGTFTIDTTATVPLDRFRLVPGNITIDVSHTYDSDSLSLVANSWSWNADSLTLTRDHAVEVSPAVFPAPPIFETRTVTETIEFLQWHTTELADENMLQSRRRFDSRLGLWVFEGSFDRAWGAVGVGVDLPNPGVFITIRRTLIGPDTTRTDVLDLESESEVLGGAYRNLLIDGQWQAERPYVSDSSWFSVPVTSIDGLESSAMDIWAIAPVIAPPGFLPVPEPTSFLLLAFGFACYRFRQRD